MDSSAPAGSRLADHDSPPVVRDGGPRGGLHGRAGATLKALRADRCVQALAALVLLAVLARGSMFVRVARTGLLDDPDNYLPLARSLAAGRGFSLDGHPTAYRPPLYPMALAPVAGLLGDRVAWGVAALHLALGALAVVLTARCARLWGLSAPRAVFAAAVVALDPVLVAQSGAVMTETLAATLSAAAIVSLSAPGLRGPALGGLFFGLGALCRPSALPVLGLTAASAFTARRAPVSLAARRALVLLAVAGLTLAPWAWRNTRAVGEAVWTTTHGGYTLALANNPVYYAEVVNGPPGAVWTGHNQWLWWDAVNRRTRGLSEPAADRMLRGEAISLILADPADFARAALARLGRFWGLSPAGAVYPRWLRLATAFWTLPLWVALVLGLSRRESWEWPRAAAPAALIALSLVHCVYWTDMRMRAAAVPAIALVAASARRPVSRDFPSDSRPSGGVKG